MWKKLIEFLSKLFSKAPAVVAPTPIPSPHVEEPVVVQPAPVVAPIARPKDLPASNHYASNSAMILAAEYRYLYPLITVEAKFQHEVSVSAQIAVKQKAMYGGTVVPWYVIAAIHHLEGGANPATQILNGQKWNQKSTIVPKGCGPFSSFEESLKFAITRYASAASWNIDLSKKNWNDIGWVFWFLESWNGFTYRKLKNPNTTPLNASPYIYSGAVLNGNPLFVKGKDVSDGNFQAEAPSSEVGAMAFIKYLESSGAIKI